MSVTFLPDDPDGPPEPPEPDRPGAGRRTRVSAIVLAAACVLAAVAWAEARSSSPSRPAARHTTALPSPTSARPTARPTPVVADPCRGLTHCSISAVATTAVRAAVAQHVPGASGLAVRTVRGQAPGARRNGLVVRTLALTVGPARVLVRVQRGGSATGAITADPPGVGSLLVHTVTRGYVVRLQYLAPETVPPQLDRLRALIADPRLVTP